jgi:hypothetical protein
MSTMKLIQNIGPGPVVRVISTAALALVSLLAAQFSPSTVTNSANRIQTPVAAAVAGESLVDVAPAPVLQPTRDVDITYNVTQAKKVTRERVRWSASYRLERVDRSTRSTTIINRNSRQSTLLIPRTHVYLQLEGVPRGPIEIDEGAALTRTGGSKLLGLQCTDWSWTDNGETRTVCATPDGVLVRLVVGGKTLVQAVSVKYRNQPAELFEIPLNYTPALVPEGAGP